MPAVVAWLLAPMRSVVPPSVSARVCSRALSASVVPAVLSRLMWAPASVVWVSAAVPDARSSRPPRPSTPLRCRSPLPALMRSAAPSPVRARVSALPLPLAVMRTPAARLTWPVAASVRSLTCSGSVVRSMRTSLADTATARTVAAPPALPVADVVALPRVPPSSTLAAPLALSWPGVISRLSAAALPGTASATRMRGAARFRSPPTLPLAVCEKSSVPCNRKRMDDRFKVPASAGPRGTARSLARTSAAKKVSAELSINSDDCRATACGVRMKPPGSASARAVPAVPSVAPTSVAPLARAMAVPGSTLLATGLTRKPPGSRA